MSSLVQFCRKIKRYSRASARGSFHRGSGRAPVGAGVPDGPFYISLPKECSAPPSAGHFWPQPQKWPKTLLETAGFKTSCAVGVRRKTQLCITRDLERRISSYNESLAVLLSLPLPCTARWVCWSTVWAMIKSRTCRRRQVYVRPAGPRKI